MYYFIYFKLNVFNEISYPREAISAGNATIIMPIEAVAARSDVLKGDFLNFLNFNTLPAILL